MAESVVLTKSTNDDYQIVIDGVYSYTKQFPRADYSVCSQGVKLNNYVGERLMFKFYLPAEWTVGVTSGFTTNKQVTDAIAALENS